MEKLKISLETKNLTIQKMTKNQVDDVVMISKELFLDGTKDEFEKTIQSDVLDVFVLQKNENVIGFFECKIISPEAELYDIAIAKNFQGQGLSKILMQFFVDYSKDKLCETIFLEVNSMNSKAISLYEKFGFKVYSIRKNYYGENDAILMKKDL